MQTFCPYPSFHESLLCLDYRRLGKQRLEAKQIITALERGSGGWYNHPAVQMWKNFIPALKYYYNCAIEEWVERGYKNTMELYPLRTEDLYNQRPFWLGDEKFHASHRSNLLRKNPTYYAQFGWTEPNNLPYVWPV